jgi:hypothetical protein
MSACPLRNGTQAGAGLRMPARRAARGIGETVTRAPPSLADGFAIAASEDAHDRGRGKIRPQLAHQQNGEIARLERALAAWSDQIAGRHIGHARHRLQDLPERRPLRDIIAPDLPQLPGQPFVGPAVDFGGDARLDPALDLALGRRALHRLLDPPLDVAGILFAPAACLFDDAERFGFG